MKIYLASYIQPENHGPGRKIAISSTKPDKLKVDGAFDFVIPAEYMLTEYKNRQLQDQMDAVNYFENAYNSQLETFFNDVKKSAEKDGTSVLEQLPLREGDTLLSWERKGYANYRTILAKFLEKAGYDVVLQ